MSEGKYGKILTIILGIVVIAVLILLGFLGYDVYRKKTIDKDTSKVLDDFDTKLNSIARNDTVENVELPDIDLPTVENVTTNTNTTGGNATKRVQYKGYNVDGKIQIPAINLEYPILEKVTPSSIEAAVAILYSANGLNQPGNTVISGHNYRNGSFFGNNDKLKLGDKVYITDNSGTKLKYNIYNIYETSPDDGDFIMRDTNGKREISLQTCTDNSKGRLIIWAVEE